MKRVALFHPGDMGCAAGRALAAAGSEVLVHLDGRSVRTCHDAAAAGLTAVERIEDAVRTADLVLSLVPPAAALEVAERAAEAAAATAVTPLYLDANSVAPATARRAAAVLAAAGVPLVDGAFVGGAKGLGGRTALLLSGTRAVELARALPPALRARVVGTAVGDASALKMAVAAFNKGLVALFVEVAGAGARIGALDPLLELLGELYPGTMRTLERLVPSYPRHVARRVVEMGEAADWMRDAGQAHPMTDATRATFERLAAKGLDPERSWEVRELLEELAGAGKRPVRTEGS